MAPRRSPSSAAVPAPGAGESALLHGDFAIATVGGATYSMFEWRVETRTRTINVRAHGERWVRRQVVESEWRFTGKGYLTSNSATTAMAAGFTNEEADPTAVSVICYSGDSGDAPIFTGSGVMVGATLEAPDGGMAIQEIEVEGDSSPSVGVLNPP